MRTRRATRSALARVAHFPFAAPKIRRTHGTEGILLCVRDQLIVGYAGRTPRRHVRPHASGGALTVLHGEENVDISKTASLTKRVERHWIAGKVQDLPVYTIAIANLYFNIENGRYAERMIKLRRDNPGVDIDPTKDEWKDKIEALLAGEGEGTSRDHAAFERLKVDIRAREQLRPGVTLKDGGVIDGNRRLAALRRLWRESKNTARFSTFDAVILPEDTTAEDRWRVEAGLQLGVQERWDYSPVNELLKIRQGLKLYQDMIDKGALPSGASAHELVAKSIFGRSAADIFEMSGRLQLIDEYLTFIGDSEAYHRTNELGEAFLEARKVMTAAENQQRPPSFLAKLKAVLFYVIHTREMDNYDIRDIYSALGGDPRKRGRRAEPRPEVLDELLGDYPDVRKIRELISVDDYLVPADDDDDVESAGEGSVPDGPSAEQEEWPADDATDDGQRPGTDRNDDQAPPVLLPTEDGSEARDRLGSATERFKRRMKASKKRQSARKLAEGARTDLENLEKRLSDPSELSHLTDGDRTSILDALDAATGAAARCQAYLEE